MNLGFFIDIGGASLMTFVLYLHCIAIYKGAGFRRFLRSIVILTMTSFARGFYQSFFRARILELDNSAVVWRYTSPIKGEVVDVRIAHRYIVFARSFFWKRGRLIGLLFSAACWCISGKLSQSQHNDLESFASSKCEDSPHRDGIWGLDSRSAVS